MATTGRLSMLSQPRACLACYGHDFTSLEDDVMSDLPIEDVDYGNVLFCVYWITKHDAGVVIDVLADYVSRNGPSSGIFGSWDAKDAARKLRAIGAGLLNATKQQGKIQNMPLRIRRSFTRGTPRGLFGNIGLMANHSQSVSA